MHNDNPTLSLASPLRSLGVVERSFEWFNQDGVVTHVVAAPLCGNPVREELQSAVNWLQQEYPILQTHIESRGGTLCLISEGTPGVQVETRLLAPDEDPRWPSAAHEALHRGFPSETGPLWRLIACQSAESTTLVFAFHHAIEDGLSSEAILHHLLKVASLVREQKPLPTPRFRPIHPAIESLTRARLTFWMKLWCGGRGIGRMLSPPYFPMEEEAPLERRETRVLCRSLTGEQTRALLETARAHKTTVHGALCAALMLSVARWRRASRPLRLLCDANVSLRKFSHPPLSEDEVGMFISSISWMYRVSQETGLWPLAQEVKQRTRERIEKGDPVQHPLLLEWLKFKKETVKGIMHSKGGRQQAVFVSNLGRYPFPLSEEQPYRPASFFFATGQHGMGACLWLGATTLGERLHCAFSYVRPILSEETASALVEDALALLTDL